MNTQELQKLANKLRLEAVRMVYEGKDGHPGPALSIADIVATLYFDAMNVDPKIRSGKIVTASSFPKDMLARSGTQH